MHRIARHLASPAILAGALLLGAASSAPAQLVSFGVMAGGSLSTFTGNTLSDVKHYVTFIGGAYIRLGFAGFAFQPSVYYTGKGAQTAELTETSGATTKLTYLEIPLVLRIALGPLYIGAGPAVSVNLNCKITDSGGVGNCASFGGFDASSTEVSGIAEAGLRFGHVSIGGRADLGITNAFKQDVGSLDIKTQTVSAVIAIRF
jgi:hypothetical protein